MNNFNFKFLFAEQREDKKDTISFKNVRFRYSVHPQVDTNVIYPRAIYFRDSGKLFVQLDKGGAIQIKTRLQVIVES